MSLRLSKEEIKWIERTADIESARVFNQFNILLTKLKDANYQKDLGDKYKEMIDKEVDELVELYTFLKTLRVKIETWDCRYHIDTTKKDLKEVNNG